MTDMPNRRGRLMSPVAVATELNLTVKQLWALRKRDGKFPVFMRVLPGAGFMTRKYIWSDDLAAWKKLRDDSEMNLKEVLALTGWSKSTLYLRMQKGKFPRPEATKRAGGLGTRWSRTAVGRFVGENQ